MENSFDKPVHKPSKNDQINIYPGVKTKCAYSGVKTDYLIVLLSWWCLIVTLIYLVTMVE